MLDAAADRRGVSEIVELERIVDVIEELEKPESELVGVAITTNVS